MDRNAIWLAALLALGGVSYDPTPMLAEPPCDEKCRERQYFYWQVPKIYVKFAEPTCEFCGKGSLCTENSNDKNTDGTCKTPAGKENANTRWGMMSKTLCTHGGEPYIEAEPAEKTGTAMTAAVMSCYAKKGIEGPGGGTLP